MCATPMSHDWPEIDSASKRPDGAGWGMARLGLTVQLAGMIVFFVGASTVALDWAIEAPVRTQLFPTHRPLRVLGAFVVLAGSACRFIGLCLCYATPARTPARRRARIAVLFLLISLSTGALGI